MNEDTNRAFSKEELARYSRHLLMPDVGMEGQDRLRRAKVLVVGAGGLGSPAAIYLAAAGVGQLGLVDFDVVDLTNLHRQILYAHSDVGKPKVESAATMLSRINPHVEIVTHETRLTAANAEEILAGYDTVVDGSDNFPTRYLVNDACVLTGKPYVYGSVFQFEGQVSVFCAPEGPCYRCLFREAPPPGAVPSCGDAGVLGVLPGVIGSLQAAEAIKLILGKGKPLIGRLLLYDALAGDFRKVNLSRDSKCPACGAEPTMQVLEDTEVSCGPVEEAAVSIEEITPRELKSMLDRKADVLLLDVRQPHAAAICALPDSKLVPLEGLQASIPDLDRDQEIVVYCRIGLQSRFAALMLYNAGFTKVKNLRGGILSWAREIDPTMPEY